MQFESDPALNQTIEVLVEQSKLNPDLAVWHITDSIAKLNKLAIVCLFVSFRGLLIQTPIE